MPRQNVLKQQSKGFAWTATPSATRSMGLMVIMLSSKMFSKKAKLLLRRGALAPHVMRKHNVLRLL